MAIVLAGCGGGGGLSKDEYTERFRAAIARVDSATSVTTNPSGPDREQAAREIEKVGAAYAGLRDDLSELEPPAEVEGAHGDYVSAAGELSGSFKRYGEKVREGDREAIARGIAGVFEPPTIGKLERATKSFQEKGYRLGLERPGP